MPPCDLLYRPPACPPQGPWDGFTGQFDVNAYRGATFMDPVGRGGSTGWDYQKGLQAAGNQSECSVAAWSGCARWSNQAFPLHTESLAFLADGI